MKVWRSRPSKPARTSSATREEPPRLAILIARHPSLTPWNSPKRGSQRGGNQLARRTPRGLNHAPVAVAIARYS